MDTSAAPTPASPPAEPVNGTVRIDIDFSKVQEALTFDQVTDLIARMDSALRIAVRPIRGVSRGVSIAGMVHEATTTGPTNWELALLYRSAQAKSNGVPEARQLQSTARQHALGHVQLQINPASAAPLPDVDAWAESAEALIAHLHHHLPSADVVVDVTATGGLYLDALLARGINARTVVVPRRQPVTPTNQPGTASALQSPAPAP